LWRSRRLEGRSPRGGFRTGVPRPELDRSPLARRRCLEARCRGPNHLNPTRLAARVLRHPDPSCLRRLGPRSGVSAVASRAYACEIANVSHQRLTSSVIEPTGRPDRPVGHGTRTAADGPRCAGGVLGAPPLSSRGLPGLAEPAGLALYRLERNPWDRGRTLVMKGSGVRVPSSACPQHACVAARVQRAVRRITGICRSVLVS
jgi:hypothetical protein